MTAAANGQPFDLTAAEAAMKAAAKPYVFTYNEVVYQIKDPALAPLSLQEQLAATEDVDQIAALMNAQLGEQVYTQLVEAGLSQAGLRKLMQTAIAASDLGDIPNTSRPAGRASTRK